MKLKAIKILISILLFQMNCFGQSQLNKYDSLEEWNIDISELEEILDANFEGGVNEFYKTIYSEIRYPRIAQENCKEGVMLLQIQLENGEQEIAILNQIGLEFEEEVKNGFETIAKKWKRTRINRKIQISIRFSINPDKEKVENEKAIFELKCYQMGRNLIGNAACDYRTTEYLKEQISNSMKFDDYESAILYLNEIKARFPFNKEYQELYKKSLKRIEK